MYYNHIHLEKYTRTSGIKIKIAVLFRFPTSFLKDQVSPSTADGDQWWGKECVCPLGGLGHI